jgi:cobaltochelatase CobN
MDVRRHHNTVNRPDGKAIKVVAKRGHVFVCSDSCCCGRLESGNPEVPLALLQSEWERRKLRNSVHLTTGGCLGPCELANVAMVLFDGQSVWFHSFHTPQQVIALYDYLEGMLAAGIFLQPPGELAAYQFQAFDWQTDAEIETNGIGAR